MPFNTQKITINIQKDKPTNQQTAQMWNLYRQSYKTTEKEFHEEIVKYSQYAFFSQCEQLKGFVGIQIEMTSIHKQSYLLIGFGHAVIEESARGKSLLPLVALKLMRLYWRKVGQSQTIFWSNALTYKAYLLFAKTAHTYYPNKQQGIPYQMKEVGHFIGTKYFEKNYKITTGSVTPSTCLVEDVSSLLCYKYQEDPDIRFFITNNPLHQEGEGLITFAPVTKENIWLLIKKNIQLKFQWKKEREVIFSLSLKQKHHENQDHQTRTFKNSAINSFLRF